MNRDCSKILIFQLILLLTVIVSSSAVFAADDFEVSSTPIVWRITPEQVAAYNITINNLASEERIYSIGLTSGDTTNWIISPNFIKVPAHSSSSEILNIFPKTTTSIGNYLLDVSFKYGRDIETIPLQVNMNFEGFYLDYVPNVALTVSAPDVQDPRESMKVSVRMINRNMLDMKNITLRIRSDLFFKEINTSLEPRKEKTSEFLFDMDPLLSPGVYKLFVEVYYPITDKIVSDSETEFKIDSYSSITPKFDYSKKWFIRKDTVSVENIGNYERIKEITILMPWYKRMFVSTDPDTELVRIDGKSYLQWNPSVKPMEVKTLTITTNYRLLITLILLLIAAIVAYFFFRSPVILLKEAGVLEQNEHGISEIKVKIFIKNRSRTALEHITITDRVPGITDHVESNNLGSMKPSRMTKTTAKGTILHWDLDKLDAFEERIITYRLKSKLRIVGDMSLPKTRVKFTYGEGKRERFVISPEPLFFSKLR
jgi:hypothetical protein